MKLKKFIMVVLFVLGGLELVVGIAAGYYPSLVLASCLLFGAVSVKGRLKRRKPGGTEREKLRGAGGGKARRQNVKRYALAGAFLISAVLFIFAAVMTRTFPGIFAGAFFAFFGLKKLSEEGGGADREA